MKKVLGLILAALLLVTAVPAAALAEESVQAEVRAEEQKGTIVNCKTQVNVRAKASSKSKLLGTAKKGETFTVKGASGNWVKIDFDGKDGYVYKTYIRVEGTTPDTAVEGKVGRIVNCRTAANVREKATSDSKLLGTVKKGATYTVTATAGNWVKIKYTADTEGYVYKDFIKLMDQDSGMQTGGCTAAIVNCKYAVNVRAKASSDSKIIGKAAKGRTFDMLGVEGSWIKIQYDADTVGYVFKSFVKLTGEAQTIEGKTGTIKCNTHVNIRAKATKNSKLLGTAKNGETFTVKGKSGNWIRIDYKGQTGYVYKTYIKIG
jgi:N-acetylmuramoyl-L-alanine amidase